jgi:hemoglobin/transferrin/lactoferrin receptor protein
MRTITRFIAIASLLVTGAAAAEDTPQPAPDEPRPIQELEFEALVFTGHRTARPEFEVGRSLEVVDRAALERRAPESLPDALDETPGVHVQKTNAGAGSPFIRGLVGPDNLILVDGVRFNNSTFRTGPNQYLSMIDPWALERIEVVRGPGSVLYGSDAMGGVIHAITLSPRPLDDRRFGASGRLVGSSGTLGGGGTAQLDLDTSLWDGYLGGTALAMGDLRAGGNDSQLLSDYQRYGGRLKMSQELDDAWTLTEAAFWTSIRDAGRTDTLATGRVRSYDNDDLLAYLRAERSGSAWLHGLRLNLSYHRTHELQTDWRCGTDGAGVVLDRAACADAAAGTVTRRGETDDVVDTLGFFATWEARVWDQRLRILAGADGYFDWISSAARDAAPDPGWTWVKASRGNYSDGSTYTALGLFVSSDADLVRIGDHVFNAQAGARFSWFDAAASGVPGLGDVEYRHAGLVGSAGVKYLYRDLLNVYADFSQGFRAPNLQESTALGNTGKSFDAPNAHLRPVRSNTLEVGVKLRHEWLRANVAGFTSWLDDMFIRVALRPEEWQALGLDPAVVGGIPVYRRENSGAGFYKGVEGGLSLGPFWGFTLWDNILWMEGDVEDVAGQLHPGSRVPPLLGSGGLRWEAPEAAGYVEFYVRWSARQDRLAPEDRKDLRICEDPQRPGTLLSGDACDGTPGWVTYNLRAGWRPWEHIGLQLTLENLGDLRYKTHGSGILAPGFQAMVALSGTY